MRGVPSTLVNSVGFELRHGKIFQASFRLTINPSKKFVRIIAMDGFQLGAFYRWKTQPGTDSSSDTTSAVMPAFAYVWI